MRRRRRKRSSRETALHQKRKKRNIGLPREPSTMPLRPTCCSQEEPIFTATILVARSDGVAPTLLLRCGKPGSASEYLFNLPESLTRLANSHGKSLKRLAAVFLPSASFNSVGGFPSFCLHTFRHRNEEKCVFIGPKGHEKTLTAFGLLGSAPLRKASLRILCPDYSGSCFEDEAVAVCGLCSGSIAVRPPQWMDNSRQELIDLVSESESEDEDSSFAMATTLTERKAAKRKMEEVIVLSSDEDEATERTPLLESEDALLQRNAKRRKQGVYTQHDVPTSESIFSGLLRCSNEERDHPAEEQGRINCFVVFLKKTAELLVIVMVEDSASLAELKRHPLWGYIRYPECVIKAVIHLSSPELMATEKYQKWAATLIGEQVFVDGTIGEGNGLDIGFMKVLDRGIRLRAVAEKHFPLPASFGRPPNKNGIVDPGTVLHCCGLRLICCSVDGRGPLTDSIMAHLLTQIVYQDRMETLRKIEAEIDSVHPGIVICRTLRENARAREMVSRNGRKCLDLEHPWSVYRSALTGHSIPETTQDGCDLKDKWPDILQQMEAIRSQGGIPAGLFSLILNEDPSSLLFLGTGCAEPSSWRGSSAILIRTDRGRKGILLDCGEGTYGQLVRYLGAEEAKRTVNCLECIWISHRHIDHCAGIGALLSKRDPNLEPLTVFCPRQIRRFLQAVGARCLCAHNSETSDKRFTNLKISLGIEKWSSYLVEHSVEAYAIRIDWLDGFSIVYSGDTGPCENLVRLGDTCTLLIHESTHSCKDLDRAEETKHSTWGQALEAADRMRAFRTILTHFSRRYPGLPDGLTAQKLGERASIAFDGMFVRFVDLVFLPYFNAAMEEVLNEFEFGGDLASLDDDDVIEILSETSSDDESEGLVQCRFSHLKLEN